MLEEEGVLQTDPEKTIMQKYLLYRKGLQIADIDQNDVKRDAKLALSDWIEYGGPKSQDSFLCLERTRYHE